MKFVDPKGVGVGVLTPKYPAPASNPIRPW